MKDAIGSAWLWLERIGRLAGIAACLVLSTAFLGWILVVDWQVILGGLAE
jgi:hypothetical protein